MPGWVRLQWCVGASSRFNAEARRRNLILPLENSVERGFGRVPDFIRDFRNTMVA